MNEFSPLLLGLEHNRRDARRLDTVLEADPTRSAFKQLRSCQLDKRTLLGLEELLDDPGIDYMVREGDTHESVTLVTTENLETYTSARHALKSDRFTPGTKQILETKQYRIDGTRV